MPRSQMKVPQASPRSHVQTPAHDVPETEAALWEGLTYLKGQLNLSGAAIGRCLGIPTSTINHWLAKKRVPLESGQVSNDVERLLHFIAIHRNLEAMFETPEAQQEWLKTPREDLGAKPIEKISRSFEDLLVVRQYLDYMRGRGA